MFGDILAPEKFHYSPWVFFVLVSHEALYYLLPIVPTPLRYHERYRSHFRANLSSRKDIFLGIFYDLLPLGWLYLLLLCMAIAVLSDTSLEFFIHFVLALSLITFSKRIGRYISVSSKMDYQCYFLIFHLFFVNLILIFLLFIIWKVSFNFQLVIDNMYVQF